MNLFLVFFYHKARVLVLNHFFAWIRIPIVFIWIRIRNKFLSAPGSVSNWLPEICVPTYDTGEEEEALLHVEHGELDDGDAELGRFAQLEAARTVEQAEAEQLLRHQHVLRVQQALLYTATYSTLLDVFRFRTDRGFFRRSRSGLRKPGSGLSILFALIFAIQNWYQWKQSKQTKTIYTTKLLCLILLEYSTMSKLSFEFLNNFTRSKWWFAIKFWRTLTTKSRWKT